MLALPWHCPASVERHWPPIGMGPMAAPPPSGPARTRQPSDLTPYRTVADGKGGGPEM